MYTVTELLHTTYSIVPVVAFADANGIGWAPSSGLFLDA